MASHDTPKGNTNKNNINNTEYIKTEESDNDFSKNRKAEAEEAPARQQADEDDSCAKLSPYLEHQYELEMAYAQKGAEAEAAKRTSRQDWWPENFLELSLDQRAELWRKQARKATERMTLVFFAVWRRCFVMLSRSCHPELVEASSKA